VFARSAVETHRQDAGAVRRPVGNAEEAEQARAPIASRPRYLVERDRAAGTVRVPAGVRLDATAKALAADCGARRAGSPS
jgi:hypothetical protein